MKSLSLYVHIPFCKRKCNYCDFLSFSGLEDQMENYVEALIEEIVSQSQFMKDRKVVSIFIGGGTPSVLPENLMGKIMSEITSHFNIAEGAEISIECNPGSITLEKIEVYKQNGINRVSMGLQSADEVKLKELGRIHTFEEFKINFSMLRKMGIDNINVDLMFGLSGQGMEDWKKTLKSATDLGPEHVSVYGLLIEEGTPFFLQNEKNELLLPSEDLEREMYWYANQLLKEQGYEHYEISNYSKKGFECQHNKVYWELGDYIGLGLGASSYVEGVRMENNTHLEHYMNAHGQLDALIISRHVSTREEQIEEFVFLGLRLMNGIRKSDFEHRFKESISLHYEQVIKKMIREQLLLEEGDILRLSPYGIDVSNYVFVQFLHH